MSKCVQIYEVRFLTRQLVLLSMSDIDTFLDKYKEFLPPTLLDNVSIVPINVSKNSNNYRNAVHNSIRLKA